MNINAKAVLPYDSNPLSAIKHKAYLLYEIRRGELFGDFRDHFLFLLLFDFRPFDFHLLDAGDVLGDLQLGDEVGFLGDVRLALEALQAHAPGGGREGLRGEHLVGSAKLDAVQVVDADR